MDEMPTVTSEHVVVHKDSVNIQTYYSDGRCISKSFALIEIRLNGATTWFKPLDEKRSV